MKANEAPNLKTSAADLRLPAAHGTRPESRSAIRYSLKAEAIFRWEDAAGHPREGRGNTRNISQKGAYLVTLDCPPRGASVMMSFLLPASEGETRKLRIEAEGNVLRVERASEPENGIGFAVANRRVALCANEVS